MKNIINIFLNFVSYFNKASYLNGRHQWVMCYRNFPLVNTDINMYLEAFRSRLKTFYMDRKPIKRVDDLLHMLLEREEDDFWRYKRQTFYTDNSDLFKANLNQHEAELKTLDIDLSILNESHWKVKSQWNDQYRNVSKTTELCCYDHFYNKYLIIIWMYLCKHLLRLSWFQYIVFVDS